MSGYPDTSSSKPPRPPLSPLDDDAKTQALIAYCLLGAGYFTGVFWVIGGVWAMAKISDFQGSLFEDHFANIIKVFWWGLGMMVIGIVTSFIIIGWLIIMGTFIWTVFRIVKGLSQLTSNRSYSGRD
ncbi:MULTISPECIES: hypothetical protein [unclassified Oceanobacter]|jgi:uncharacterized membrane protein|uniref:DUF4870 family protein n=1 Tax=unclassified Oceanobacter TaxID=2620260 RepID=UPI0026E2971B|nr:MULTISPECIES: hypothetical protein [unclassified Oceanobacter]MDO6681583.1 hypothetical protein [Oceanobacter sp. 5_MG-2023]MDP2505789.1 hypothetical protein [Oceanobacter sp. 3_MG-2023]MDP2547384.1 hypothetical protein [Oceanobacter sp. 4_MG-2023]